MSSFDGYCNDIAHFTYIFITIITVGSEMPMLSTSVDGHNEYINAVFLPVSWLCRMKHFNGIHYQCRIPTGKYDVPYTKTHTSPVDCRFESRSGKTKDNKIGICCLFSP